MLLVLLIFVMCIGFSAFSTITQIQASEIQNNQKSNVQKTITRTHKSKIEKTTA